MIPYYAQRIAQILTHVESSEDGLSMAAAQARLEKDGKNILPRAKNKTTAVKIILQQFASPLIFILLIAAAISGFLHEWIDMTVILMTVAVNTIVGFVQEFKANKALEKLQHMIQYCAMVLRDGHKQEIDGADVVVGDIMLLEAGDKIQADGRIMSCKNFAVIESSLTGESDAQEKQSKKLSGGKAIGDRVNMVFRGTTVADGRATIVVTATGNETEIGKIASLVQDTKEDKTPLQQQLSKLARWLGIIVLGISVLIFALGYFVQSEHYTVFELFETAVALAVAAIPEGLVISMTVILAIGMQYILRRNALVRRLVAAETLGSVNVICTDKTGTLTEGNMSVMHMVTADDDLNSKELRSISHDTYGKHNGVVHGLKIAVLANDGLLENPDDTQKDWHFIGDTTDTAFVKLGMEIGLEKHHLEYQYKRIDEVPFTSDNKYIATLHENDTTELFVKGAPEVLLEKSTSYFSEGKKKRMIQKQKEWFLAKQKEMTEQGLRVIGVASRDEKKSTNTIVDIEKLTFVGLIALSDPLRSDVAEVLRTAEKAGIRVIMITGDHEVTAQSIARELGLPSVDDSVFNGTKLETVSDDELSHILTRVSVFARVDPKHKIRIVQALQKQGDVVAMTGDGVNDAPAIKAADIGIAVGSGTDVAKEIADVVILDDNFKTIVGAVEEGRGMYQNIKKIVLYLMAGSFAEVLLVLGSLVAGLPLPVLPVQILWVNLIQDSFPNMALAFDRGDKDNMKEKPRKRNAPIFDHEMKIMISLFTVVMNVILFSIFLYYLNTTGNLELARTVTFVGLAIGCLLYIYSVRSMRKQIWQMPMFDNKYLNGAVAIGWILLVGAIYFPPLQVLLSTVPLGLSHWVVLIGFGLVNLFTVEIMKVFLFRSKKINNIAHG